MSVVVSNGVKTGFLIQEKPLSLKPVHLSISWERKIYIIAAWLLFFCRDPLSLSCTLMLFQTLQWDCPGGLNGSESLQVDVFDHETLGKNR